MGLTKTEREPPSSPPSFVKTAATVPIPVNSANPDFSWDAAVAGC